MKRLALGILLLVAQVALAHKPSVANLRLAVDGDTLVGQLSIAVRDLDGALDVDADGNGDITWAETTAAGPRVASYVRDRLELDSGGPCTVITGAPALVDLTDGAYWTTPLTIKCPSRPRSLAITYKLLFDIDAQHRGIIHLQAPGFAQTVVVKSPQPVTIDIADPTATWAVISAGGRALALAPLLALALLLLPPRRRGTLRDDAMLAGTFALAQIITLVLVASGALDLPAAWVTPVIALSVCALGIATAAGVGRNRGALAIELGLLHGVALAYAFALPARGLPPRRAVRGGALRGPVALGSLFAFARTRFPAAAVRYGAIAGAIAGAILTVYALS